MRALYTFGVYCYGLAIRLASLFNPKAKNGLEVAREFLTLFLMLRIKKLFGFTAHL